ncbi:MAG: FHA domain-containing protein [Deltaproteobacteria bacterium]|nr:FHA domain-containing protein [Deltaproteobacteria bacterium]
MGANSTWAIRILTGTQSGQIVPLASGYNIIGRSPSCQIKLASNSVSKEHATVLMTDDGKVIITDMGSRNGTFVNGLRIQNQKLNPGDKLTFHDVVVDVLELPPGFDPRFVPGASPGGGPPMPTWAGNAALAVQPQYQPHQPAQQDHHDYNHAHAQATSHPESGAVPQAQYTGNLFIDFFENIRIYFDHVAMPGIYSIVQKMNYRQGIVGFVILYVILVTIVSTVPMVNMTKKGIRQESIRRAKTIATNLAVMNRQAILERNEIAATVKLAELEEGVTNAIIMAKDGTILAPANKRGEFAKLPFVNQARREEKTTEGFITDSTLGVAVPIARYNPESGSQEAAAYAIIIYDMGSLAMNTAQTLGLFLQIFLLAGVIGGILSIFLIRVVEHPLETLGLQLDDALREGRDDLSTAYQYPILEKLVSNINSALSRAASGGGGYQSPSAVLNRDIEANNIVRMLPIPAICINAIDDRIISTNTSFDALIGSGVALAGRPVNDVPDPALQANLRDLIPKMRDQLGSIAFSQIPFSGQSYEINGQAVVGNGGEAAWYLVTLHNGGG